MSLSKRALVAGLLVVSQGCYLDFRGPGKPRLVAGKPHTPIDGGFGSKVVEVKRQPVWLVAGDGTSCAVPEKKFNTTVVGESVWCTWLGSNR
jgi:hypothetical protein